MKPTSGETLAQISAQPDDPGTQSTGVDEFVSRVGARIRQVRQFQSLSRRELSEKSGVSQRYLAQLEAGEGNISIGLLYKVCMALGCRPDWLLGEADPFDADYGRFRALFNVADLETRAAALAVLQPALNEAETACGICLLGLRGAGKSTLGKIVAKRLALPFVELNQIIEEQSGIPVSEVIALYGQDGYRQLEKKALETVTLASGPVVLAVGGGIVSEPETYEHLLKNFHTIWLKASPDDHMNRVRGQGDNRPMAGNPKAMEELRSILTEREALYARADVTIDTSGFSVDASAKALLKIAEILNLRDYQP